MSINLDDLYALEICENCRHVYKPRFANGMDFAHTPYPINDRLCEVCEPLTRKKE